MKAKNLKVGYPVKVSNIITGETMRGIVWEKDKKSRLLVLSVYGVCSIPYTEAKDENKWKFKLVRRL